MSLPSCFLPDAKVCAVVPRAGAPLLPVLNVVPAQAAHAAEDDCCTYQQTC